MSRRPIARGTRLDPTGSVALITQGGLVSPSVTVPAAPVAAPRQPAATARQVAEDQAHRRARDQGETTTPEDPPSLVKFHAPEIVFGIGSLGEAGFAAARLGARRPMVVTDPGIIEAGWVDELARPPAGEPGSSRSSGPTSRRTPRTTRSTRRTSGTSSRAATS